MLGRAHMLIAGAAKQVLYSASLKRDWWIGTKSHLAGVVGKSGGRFCERLQDGWLSKRLARECWCTSDRPRLRPCLLRLARSGRQQRPSTSAGRDEPLDAASRASLGAKLLSLAESLPTPDTFEPSSTVYVARPRHPALPIRQLSASSRPDERTRARRDDLAAAATGESIAASWPSRVNGEHHASRRARARVSSCRLSILRGELQCARV